MPLIKDKRGGGTEADGTRSKMYCSYCYDNGEFINPDMSVDEMKELVKDIAKEKLHVPGFIAQLLTTGIPNLERWKRPNQR